MTGDDDFSPHEVIAAARMLLDDVDTRQRLGNLGLYAANEMLAVETVTALQEWTP